MPLLSTIAMFAVAAQAAPPPAPPAPPPAAEKKVCRRPTATGTILVRKQCRAASEWARIDAQNRAAAEQALDGRRSSGR